MNPGNLSHLDPKLKEAYERVMGTPISSFAPTASSSPAYEKSQSSFQPSSQMVVGGKTKGKLSPILIMIALILFFAVYTIMWIIVFDLKVPFLP